MSFTHLDGDGNVSMVDVSSKPGTLRTARASGWILMRPETVGLLSDEGMPKGNVLTAAKVAAIQAAKWTAHIIPLCHQLNLSWVDVSFEVQVDRIAIFATTRTKEATGVEMEALTAVSVAALTIYDMCKAVDKTMEIGGIRLDMKTGGKTDFIDAYRPRTSILVLSDSISAGVPVTVRVRFFGREWKWQGVRFLRFALFLMSRRRSVRLWMAGRLRGLSLF